MEAEFLPAAAAISGSGASSRSCRRAGRPPPSSPGSRLRTASRASRGPSNEAFGAGMRLGSKDARETQADVPVRAAEDARKAVASETCARGRDSEPALISRAGAVWARVGADLSVEHEIAVIGEEMRATPPRADTGASRAREAQETRVQPTSAPNTASATRVSRRRSTSLRTSPTTSFSFASKLKRVSTSR